MPPSHTCSTGLVRWDGQRVDAVDGDALPGLGDSRGLVRTFDTPEFRGMEFLEIASRSALNRVPGTGFMGGAWTVNPYRGCQHACVYCLSPDTLILMADGSQRRIGDLAVGDEIIGTELVGRYRRYVRTVVHATWTTTKRAYRVTLADGTELVASGDHRFLTERGWKHVTRAVSGDGQRPYLTTNNRLMGFGSVGPPRHLGIDDRDYRRGYLTGMIRGDGMIFHGEYADSRRTRRIHRFRLALADAEALERSELALAAEGIATQARAVQRSFRDAAQDDCDPCGASR